MTKILEQIENDYIEAMKSKNTEVVGVLRMAKAALSNAKIAKGKDLEDQDVISVLAKEVKSREDSVAQYKSGNRPELAEKEEAEIMAIKKYLPEQMADEELSQIIESVISESGASSMKDMGMVMGKVIAKTAGRADNSKISQMVKEKLS